MDRNSLSSAAGKRRLSVIAGGVALGVAIGFAVPVELTGSGLQIQVAQAGKGGGNGGANGGGRGGRSDTARGGERTAHAGGGNAYGHAKGGTESNRPGEDAGGTAVKLPGSLNAAHASPQAFEHASSKSRIGALRAYMDAMTAYSDAVADGREDDRQTAIDAATTALADAANKPGMIDAEVLDALNETLDGKRPGFSHSAAEGDPVHDAEPAVANRFDLSFVLAP